MDIMSTGLRGLPGSQSGYIYLGGAKPSTIAPVSETTPDARRCSKTDVRLLCDKLERHSPGDQRWVVEWIMMCFPSLTIGTHMMKIKCTSVALQRLSCNGSER